MTSPNEEQDLRNSLFGSVGNALYVAVTSFVLIFVVMSVPICIAAMWKSSRSLKNIEISVIFCAILLTFSVLPANMIHVMNPRVIRRAPVCLCFNIIRCSLIGCLIAHQHVLALLHYIHYTYSLRAQSMISHRTKTASIIVIWTLTILQACVVMGWHSAQDTDRCTSAILPTCYLYLFACVVLIPGLIILPLFAIAHTVRILSVSRNDVCMECDENIPCRIRKQRKRKCVFVILISSFIIALFVIPLVDTVVNLYFPTLLTEKTTVAFTTTTGTTATVIYLLSIFMQEELMSAAKNYVKSLCSRWC